jgi:hypothetical protein
VSEQEEEEEGEEEEKQTETLIFILQLWINHHLMTYLSISWDFIERKLWKW